MRNWRKRKQGTRDQNTFCSESEEDSQVEQQGEKKPRSTLGKLLICCKVALSFWLWCSSQESVKSVTCWGHYTVAAAVHYLCILLFFNTNRAHRCKSVYVCLKLSETAIIISLLCLCHGNTTVFVCTHAFSCAAFSGSGPQIALGLRKLCPAKRAWSPNSSSILWGRGGGRAGRGNVSKDDSKQTKRKEERDHHCRKLFKITLYWHEIRAENTHLMSWLYLARRSDRQGAPVLIWRDKNTTEHEELQYIFYLLYYHDLLENNLFSEFLLFIKRIIEMSKK